MAGNQIEIINGTPEEVQKGIHDSWQSVINSAIDEDLDGVMKYLDINALTEWHFHTQRQIAQNLEFICP